MITYRWKLCALPRGNTRYNQYTYLLAKQFNSEPERFIFKWSAEAAARFYELNLGLPLKFEVIPIETKIIETGWNRPRMERMDRHRHLVKKFLSTSRSNRGKVD